MAIINGQNIKYRLNQDAGGYTEDYDLSVLKSWKSSHPGTIVAIHQYFTITNDLNGTQYNWHDDANNAINDLVQTATQEALDLYQMQHHEILVSPQPEGLND